MPVELWEHVLWPAPTLARPRYLRTWPETTAGRRFLDERHMHSSSHTTISWQRGLDNRYQSTTREISNGASHHSATSHIRYYVVHIPPLEYDCAPFDLVTKQRISHTSHRTCASAGPWVDNDRGFGYCISIQSPLWDNCLAHPSLST